MIIVHYLENSRAHRALWLLEELGLDYEIRTYKRGPDLRAPAALKEVHPLGKSPIIEDDGVIVAESGAITSYLLDKFGDGRLVPDSDEGKLRHTYWLHYAEGSAMPPLLMKLIFDAIPKLVPFFIRPFATVISKGVTAKLIGPQLDSHLAFWEMELSRDGYFAGSKFSAADIMMSFPVEAGLSRMTVKGETGSIATWLEAIRSREGYKRALERGGAYAFSRSTV